jgi:hypothetical protein
MKLTRRQERKVWKDQRAAEEASKIHVAKDGTEYRKVNGLWFEVLWGEVTGTEIRRMERDKIVTIIIPYSRQDIFTDKWHDKIGDLYRSGKRQLSKKELRDLGLANG